MTAKVTEADMLAALSGMFVKWNRKRYDFKPRPVPVTFIPDYSVLIPQPSDAHDEILAALLDVTCREMSASASELRSDSRLRRLVMARRVYLWIAVVDLKVEPSNAARFIGMHHTMASPRELRKLDKARFSRVMARIRRAVKTKGTP